MCRASQKNNNKTMSVYEDKDERESFEAPYSGLMRGRSIFEMLSPEVLCLILEFLPAKTLLNLSETSRKFNSECIGNDGVWKDLLKRDFQISMLVKGQFSSYHDVYAIIYKSQIIFEERNHVTFSGILPDWMFIWCTLCLTPPGARFNFFPIGRAKRIWGISDEKLPRRISWVAAHDAAIEKWESESSFQEQVLKRLFRVTKKVESLFPDEARNRRLRFFKGLRLKEKCSVMEDVLVKNRSSPAYLSYFQPQLIGEHYIDGKLLRFGKRQLKEYIKFANQLYDDAKSKLDHFSEADLVQCVLLSYNDLSNQTEDESLIKCKVFLEYSYKFIARQQKVRRWQNEKGISHQMQYRSTEKVQSNESYRDYIRTGDVYKFLLLLRFFEGLERISEWVSMNSWILDFLDLPVRDTLTDRDNVVIPLPGQNNDAKDVQRKMNVYLQSGKEHDFRSVLSAIVIIAKTRLRRSANLIEELEGLIENGGANLLVSVETEVFVKDIYSVTSTRSEEKGSAKSKGTAGIKSKRKNERRQTKKKNNSCD